LTEVDQDEDVEHSNRDNEEDEQVTQATTDIRARDPWCLCCAFSVNRDRCLRFCHFVQLPSEKTKNKG
jgi:hypothetical protein